MMFLVGKKRGMGFYFKNIEKKGFNPITKEEVTVKRKVLFSDLELPMKEEYRNFISGLIND